MSDQQKLTNLTGREINFWMRAYIAFIPRILEKPPFQDIRSFVFCNLTPAEVADKAVIELRERLGTCQPSPAKPELFAIMITNADGTNPRWLGKECEGPVYNITQAWQGSKENAEDLANQRRIQFPSLRYSIKLVERT